VTQVRQHVPGPKETGEAHHSFFEIRPRGPKGGIPDVKKMVGAPFKPCFGLSGQTKLPIWLSSNSRYAPGTTGKAGLKRHYILCLRLHDKLRTAGH
jgi:hypothetical protein